MTENLDHLLCFKLTTDRWRQLIVSRELVERDTKVLEILWQLVFLAERLVLFFSNFYLLCDEFGGAIWISTEASQNVCRDTCRIGKESCQEIK